MSDPRYPALYQINTRVWLTELSRALGRRATLDDIPDAELDRLAEHGLRLGLVPERLADRPGGAGDLARESRVASRVRGNAAGPARTKTSPAPGSPSRATPSIAIWAALPRWRVCDSGCNSAD